MITEAPDVATGLLAAAATAVATTLPASEPLSAGNPTRDADEVTIGSQAVLVPFTGTYSGDLLLLVDDEVSQALASTSIGALDLAAALAPVVSAVGAAIGSLAFGPATVVDARLGLHRLLGNPDAAVLPLLGTSGVRAAAGIAVTPTVSAFGAPPAGANSADQQSQRLDMLRGVEMDATAELGRARMTVNDLLALRTGAVIELDRSAGAAADLFVNGRLIARGEVVVVDENYGLRITQIVSDDNAR